MCPIASNVVKTPTLCRGAHGQLILKFDSPLSPLTKWNTLPIAVHLPSWHDLSSWQGTLAINVLFADWSSAYVILFLLNNKLLPILGNQDYLTPDCTNVAPVHSTRLKPNLLIKPVQAQGSVSYLYSSGLTNTSDPAMLNNTHSVNPALSHKRVSISPSSSREGTLLRLDLVSTKLRTASTSQKP